MKRNIVADCSVLVKLFVPETGSGACAEYFEPWAQREIDVWIPELATIEFANVMWHKVGRKELELQGARACISDFLKLPFRLAGHGALVKAAFRLSVELGITAYDACYAALAYDLRSPLVTADKKLAGLLKGSAIAVEVIQ